MEEKRSETSNAESNWAPTTPVKRTPAKRALAATETPVTSRLKGKKIRPKVVREEKPKRAPKKEGVRHRRTPSATPVEGARRRYRTRRKQTKPDSAEATEIDDGHTASSCKRSLNFGCDSQACHNSTPTLPQSTLQHPVNVRPSTVANSDDPLSFDGNQTCGLAQEAPADPDMNCSSTMPGVMHRTAGSGNPVEGTKHRYNTRSKPPISGGMEVIKACYLTESATENGSCKRLHFDSGSVHSQPGLADPLAQNSETTLIENSSERLTLELDNTLFQGSDAPPAPIETPAKQPGSAKKTMWRDWCPNAINKRGKRAKEKFKGTPIENATPAPADTSAKQTGSSDKSSWHDWCPAPDDTSETRTESANMSFWHDWSPGEDKARREMVKEKPKRTPKKDRVPRSSHLAIPVERARFRHNTRTKPLENYSCTGFKGKGEEYPTKVCRQEEATMTPCPISTNTYVKKKAIMDTGWDTNPKSNLHWSNQYGELNQKEPVDSAEAHLSEKYGSVMEPLEEAMNQHQVGGYKYKHQYISKRKQQRHFFQSAFENHKLEMYQDPKAYEFLATIAQDSCSDSTEEHFTVPVQNEALDSKELPLLESEQQSQQHDDEKCSLWGRTGFFLEDLMMCMDLLDDFKGKRKRTQRKKIGKFLHVIANDVDSVIVPSSIPRDRTLESSDASQAREESLFMNSRLQKSPNKRTRKVTSRAVESMVSTGPTAQDICIYKCQKSQAANANYKKELCMDSSLSEVSVVPFVEEMCKRLMCLNISSEDTCDAAEAVDNSLVPYIRHGELVSYAETTQTSKKKKLRAKVDLDEESDRVWHLLMGGGLIEITNGTSDQKEHYWEEERRLFCGRVDSFLAKMHLIQGNRSFSKWKGSVVDSVVGVFLTLNVSDTLSSSAFMSLAASFPLKENNERSNTKKEEPATSTMDKDFFDRASYDAMADDAHKITLAGEKFSLGTLASVDFLEKENADGLSEPKCTTQNAGNMLFEVPVDSLENAFSMDKQEHFESMLEFSLDNNVNINENKISKKPVKSYKRKEEQLTSKEKWDPLRKQVVQEFGIQERSEDTDDSVDWEAVRQADIDLVAQTIKHRGMNNIVAGRIKGFLDRMMNDHDTLNLEWLRHAPPEKAKDFLLSINGLGLKSVECVRLLTLQQLAFPVDTNVGRICVRLGWVPLQPLPESLQLHLLELYPMLNTIQKYLWPRLCKIDQQTLYELHYQLITFGKVFCTKKKPNCNACPMRGECRHFASAFSSARLSLPANEEKTPSNSKEPIQVDAEEGKVDNILSLPLDDVSRSDDNPREESHDTMSICEPIIEVPSTPEPTYDQFLESDIEDFSYEDPDEIPCIKLNFDELELHIRTCMQENNITLQHSDISKALVALTPEAASIPVRKSKNVNRLRTEHLAYILPDDHFLLDGVNTYPLLDNREQDDPCPYLLIIWSPGETAESVEPAKTSCNFQSSGNLCTDQTCFSCNANREMNYEIVRGTLLIPCRTAMRGSFPLNGTYFQVNEVFADHKSSICPLNVRRELIWNLPRRVVYFGTSVTAIFRGLTTEEIQYCFRKGFLCVRGFDRETRAPQSLTFRQHFPASKHSPNKEGKIKRFGVNGRKESTSQLKK